MAQEHVDVVLRGLDAFNRGDIEGLIAQDEPVWEEGGVVFPDLPPAYHGHDGVRRWFQEAIVDAWESFTADLLELRDEGDGKVVQFYDLTGRGRESGIEVERQ